MRGAVGGSVGAAQVWSYNEQYSNDQAQKLQQMGVATVIFYGVDIYDGSLEAQGGCAQAKSKFGLLARDFKNGGLVSSVMMSIGGIPGKKTFQAGSPWSCGGASPSAPVCPGIGQGDVQILADSIASCFECGGGGSSLEIDGLVFDFEAIPHWAQDWNSNPAYTNKVLNPNARTLNWIAWVTFSPW